MDELRKIIRNYLDELLIVHMKLKVSPKQKKEWIENIYEKAIDTATTENIYWEYAPDSIQDKIRGKDDD